MVSTKLYVTNQNFHDLDTAAGFSVEQFEKSGYNSVKRALSAVSTNLEIFIDTIMINL